MNTDDAVAAIRTFATATLSEATAQPCDLPPDVGCMVPGAQMAGPAFTVRCPLGDNTAVTRALDEAPAGCVVVIDCGGPPRTALWGENATFASQNRGVAGCVTNGMIRDIDAIRAAKFPVFAAGLSLRGSTKGQRGEIGCDLVIGDITIRPADIVRGDADGVVVIPAAEVESVIAVAEEKRRDEDSRNARIKAGEPLAQILATSGNRT